MAGKRCTDEQWDAIRQEWEGTPTASYESAAAKVGKAMEFKPPTKGAISNRAQKEGWSKAPPLASINDGAQRRADAATTSDGELNGKLNGFSSPSRATRDESEAKRAEVLIRHRNEWAEMEGYRRIAVAAMGRAHEAWKLRKIDIGKLKSNDAELNIIKSVWAIAKMAAETAKANLAALETKQAGERKAWGLGLTGDDEIVIVNPRREEE